MTRPFRNKKSLWWLLGMALLITGFLAFSIIVPSRTEPPGSEGPDVNVPNMQNVPPPGAPDMQLQTE